MSIEELKQLQNKVINKTKKINRISVIIYILLVGIEYIYWLYRCGIHIKDLNSKMIFMLFLPLMFILLFNFFPVLFGNLIAKLKKVNKDIKIFNDEFKKTFVFNKLNNTFDNLKYDKLKGFNRHDIISYDTLDTSDRYSSNDYICGTYHNINFEQADIHIEEEHETTDSEGNTDTYYVTLFKGRYMIFDFNKTFKANMITTTGGVPLHYRSNNKINLENVEFNKRFKVYSDIEHDVFYILTPSFMEKILDLYNKLNCDIALCFKDSKLHIAVDNGKDSFEWSVYTPIDEDKINEEIGKDISLITDFVNELDLDNDLFRKDEING